ncbi:MAG: tail fiber domain-containing protein, partial [Dysgonamonadaceae bacterium]|nr:tail fiber domain-containing protein [Dysgonamonadaceae bacterium]
MKTIQFVILCMGICLCASLSAQTKVDSNGRLQIGNYFSRNSSNNDYDNRATAQLFGYLVASTGNNVCGSMLTFGDFGGASRGSLNVLVGEYGTTDTDKLWLHGKYGTYFTYNQGTPWAYYDPQIGNYFTVNCQVKANGVVLTSDERLKKNIRSLTGSLSLLQQLEGVSYNLLESVASSSQSKSSSGDLTEKEKRDSDFFENWEKEMRENKDVKIGFLAQDLREVFPELVQEDKEGMLSVDYIGLIPVIVESIKEQQQIIGAQSEKIKELETVIDGLTEKTSLRSEAETNVSTDLNTISAGNLTNAFLYQNVP